jgi:hypothetical protein
LYNALTRLRSEPATSSSKCTKEETHTFATRATAVLDVSVAGGRPAQEQRETRGRNRNFVGWIGHTAQKYRTPALFAAVVIDGDHGPKQVNSSSSSMLRSSQGPKTTNILVYRTRASFQT